MTLKDIILHLRIPFSIFLMPIYWLAVSQQSNASVVKNIWVFIVLHLLVYPASNAYNSYFDKDEGSIGGLKNPPKVDKKLWISANLFDILAIMCSLVFVDYWFTFFIFLYILVSRIYSHPMVKIKKFAVLSWLIVGLFQGALVFFMVYVFGQNLSWGSFFEDKNTHQVPIWWGSILSALILWSVYPLTQIYQHDEDARNGIKTISMKLGIRGTFVFTIFIFLWVLGISWYFLPINHLMVFIISTLPVAAFLNLWFYKVWKNPQEANFKNTMILNTLASVLLNICFIINSFKV